MKKQHPCGGQLWRVERTGADIHLKCLTCGRFITMPRRKLEKAIKSIEPSEEPPNGCDVLD